MALAVHDATVPADADGACLVGEEASEDARDVSAVPTTVITLLYNDLAYLPTSKTWKSTQKGTIYNCTSTDVTACPFSIRAKAPKTNIYKDALDLRQEADPYDTPGF
jgi:hypothetical protein